MRVFRLSHYKISPKTGGTSIALISPAGKAKFTSKGEIIL
jgi:hypothetical protein